MPASEWRGKAGKKKHAVNKSPRKNNCFFLQHLQCLTSSDLPHPMTIHNFDGSPFFFWLGPMNPNQFSQWSVTGVAGGCGSCSPEHRYTFPSSVWLHELPKAK